MKVVRTTDINLIDPQLLTLQPFINTEIDSVLPSNLAHEKCLVFISRTVQLEEALARGAKSFIILDSLIKDISHLITSDLAIWTTQSIQSSMSQVLKLFDQASPHLKNGAHPSSVIHPTAQVAASAHIGPYCVVGAYAQIGENTVLTAHDYIGAYCQVGANCLLAPFVSIGQDGLGFFTDKNFTHHKIPQIGRVVIEDNCEFGAHCAVDRATLTETRICQGSKFDNFCHVAHNVQIGQNAITAAGFIVAGSSQIGRNLMTAGGVHIVGHVKVTDNVILSGRAAVTSDITTSGMYGGFPIELHRDSIKTLSSLPHLKTLRKQVKKILKHLQLNEEEIS